MDINSGMKCLFEGPLPSMRALRVFEAAARHQSFSRTAEEFGSTQPAISRTITELEHCLGFRLFERLHRGVRLTEAGALYRETVVTGLTRIAEGGSIAAGMPDDNRIVIGCPHAISEMFLMPRFQDLQRDLGEGVTAHVIVCDYDSLPALESGTDLVLTYSAGDSEPEDRAIAFRDAVMPLCSPAYAEKHADILRRPVATWGSLTFLYLARPSRGWTTWEDWFEAVGRPNSTPRYVSYSDYVYLMDGACAGRGIALGWQHFLERYVDTGTLVKIRDDFLERDPICFAKLTERGRRRAHARLCLDFFAARSQCARQAGLSPSATGPTAAESRDAGLSRRSRTEEPVSVRAAGQRRDHAGGHHR